MEWTIEQAISTAAAMSSGLNSPGQGRPLAEVENQLYFFILYDFYMFY
jgi:hypothetical protein